MILMHDVVPHVAVLKQVVLRKVGYEPSNLRYWKPSS